MDPDARNSSSMLLPVALTESVGNKPTSQTQTQMPTEKANVESIKRGGIPVPFPYKLHVMLNNMDFEAAKGDLRGKLIVGWLPHGKAFRVHNKDEFVDRVMPIFFNGSKYSSFLKQLNLYSFIRITNGPDKGAVYHPNFVRNQTDMVKNIVRQRRIKGTKIRKPVDFDTQPNFYATADMRAKAAIDIAFDLAFFRNDKTDEANNHRDPGHGVPLPQQGCINPNHPLSFR